LLISKGN